MRKNRIIYQQLILSYNLPYFNGRTEYANEQNYDDN